MARPFAKAFYNSKAWKQVRDAVLKRDLYLCVNCGQPAEEVHHKIHLSPTNINDSHIALNCDNLVSLCRACHFDIHKEDKAKALREKNKSPACADEYYFDENGFLVRKDSPPNFKF